MKEIEILVKIFNKKNANSVEKKLRSIARFIGDINVHDVYYYDPLRKGQYFRKDGRFSESFRIREKDRKTYITHKHDIFDKRSNWLYSEELETKVEDFSTAKKIIEAIGMKKLVDVRILKKTFKTRDYEIVLENVRGLGLFLEVEALRIRRREKISIVKKRIWAFIKNLGVTTSRELGVGKAEMVLMKKNIKKA